MTDKFAVIDFETSGLSPHQGDRAIEIGVALFDGERVIDTYQSLMNPGVEVPYFIEDLTGISQEMVDDSPASTTVMREVRQIIGDLPIVAHNASFDKRFMDSELRRIRTRLANEFICSLRVARRVYPAAPNPKLATLVRLTGVQPAQQ